MLVLVMSLMSGALAQDKPNPDNPSNPVSPTTEVARPAVPSSRLTPEILYQLTMSEIAAQRGMVSAAFVSMLDLARRTRDPRIARRATEFAIMDRQPGNALVAGRLWNELAPESEEARNLVVNMLVATANLADAEILLQSRLRTATASTRPQALMQIQGLLTRSPNRNAAFLTMQRLAAPYPELPEARFAVAQAAQSVGDTARALTELRAALALRPDWDLAALTGAQILQSQSLAASIAWMTEYLTRTPGSQEGRLALARLHAGNKQTDRARVEFGHVLQVNPTHPDALMALGVLDYQAKNFAGATTYFQRFIESMTRSGTANNALAREGINQAWLFLSQIAEDQGQIDEAIRLLNNIASGDGYIGARARRANLLVKLGRRDEAITDLRASNADSNRERVQLIQVEAALLRDGKQFQAAFELLDDALKGQPNEPDLLYDHAMLAERLNRLDVMEASLREVIRLRPDAAHAYNALGYSLADRNLRLPEALQLIEKAISLAPEDAAIIDSLGWVHYRLGNLPKALEHLRRAYALRPDAEVATHLGEVLWVSGEHAEAERLWREAGRIEPDNEVLRATLARFNSRVDPNAR